MKRVYAWKPDVPDFRDHYFSLSTAAQLPDHVDQLGTSVGIDDQGQLGSCTGNSSTAALEIVTGAPPLSRLMAYYNGRALEGTIKTDSGCMIRDVIKGLSNLGVCNESLWPYDIAKFKLRPSVKCYTQAKQILPKVASYQRLTSLVEVKTALAAKLPVVFGFSVPDYFESQQVATDGWVRLPTQTDQMIGGHAVVAVGYDDRVKPSFIWVRNSWGKDWGLGGYFKMDQAWFTDLRYLVDDMWVIHPK